MIVTVFILLFKAACQDDDLADQSEEMAEESMRVTEAAGEIVPPVARLVSPLEFCNHFTSLLPEFLKLAVGDVYTVQCTVYRLFILVHVEFGGAVRLLITLFKQLCICT